MILFNGQWTKASQSSTFHFLERNQSSVRGTKYVYKTGQYQQQLLRPLKEKVPFDDGCFKPPNFCKENPKLLFSWGR